MLASSFAHPVADSPPSIEQNSKIYDQNEKSDISNCSYIMTELDNCKSSALLDNLASTSTETKPKDGSKPNYQHECANQKMNPMLLEQKTSKNIYKVDKLQGPDTENILLTDTTSFKETNLEDNSWEIVPMDVLNSENSVAIPSNDAVQSYLNTYSTVIPNESYEVEPVEWEVNERQDDILVKGCIQMKLKPLDKRNKLSEKLCLDNTFSDDKNLNSLSLDNLTDTLSASHCKHLESMDSGFSSCSEHTCIKHIDNELNLNKPKRKYNLIETSEHNKTPPKLLSAGDSYAINNRGKLSSKDCLKLEHPDHTSSVTSRIPIVDNNGTECLEPFSSSEDTGIFQTCTSVDQENLISSEVESEIWETLAEELDRDNSSSIEDPSEWEMPFSVDTENHENVYESNDFELAQFAPHIEHLEANINICKTDKVMGISSSNNLKPQSSCLETSNIPNQDVYSNKTIHHHACADDKQLVNFWKQSPNLGDTNIFEDGNKTETTFHEIHEEDSVNLIGKVSSLVDPTMSKEGECSYFKEEFVDFLKSNSTGETSVPGVHTLRMHDDDCELSSESEEETEEESEELSEEDSLGESSTSSDENYEREECNFNSNSSEEKLVDFSKQIYLGESPLPSVDSCKRQLDQSESSSSGHESVDLWKHDSLGDTPTPSDDSYKRQIHCCEFSSSEEESVDLWKQGSSGGSPTQYDDSNKTRSNLSDLSSSEEELVDFWKLGSIGESPTPSDDSYKIQVHCNDLRSSEESIDFWKEGSLGNSPTPSDDNYKRKVNHHDCSSSEESIDFWKQDSLGGLLIPTDESRKRQDGKYESSSSEEESIDFWKQGCLAKSPSPCDDSYKRQVENGEPSSSEEESVDFWKQGCLGKSPSPCDNSSRQAEKSEQNSSENESVDFWSHDYLGKSPSPCDNSYNWQIEQEELSSSEEESVDYWKEGYLGNPPSPCDDNCKIHELNFPVDKSVDIGKNDNLGNSLYDISYKKQVDEQMHSNVMSFETKTGHLIEYEKLNNSRLAHSTKDTVNNGDISNTIVNDYKQNCFGIGSSLNELSIDDRSIKTDLNDISESSELLSVNQEGKCNMSALYKTEYLENSYISNQHKQNRLEHSFAGKNIQEDSDSTSSEEFLINADKSINMDNHYKPSSSKLNYSKRDSVQLRKTSMLPSSKYRQSTNYTSPKVCGLTFEKDSIDKYTSNSEVFTDFIKKGSENKVFDYLGREYNNPVQSLYFSELDKSKHSHKQTLASSIVISPIPHEIVNVELEDDYESDSYEDDTSQNSESVSDLPSTSLSNKLHLNIEEDTKLDETYTIINRGDLEEEDTKSDVLHLPETSDEVLESDNALRSKSSSLENKDKFKDGPESRTGSPRQKKVDFDLSATSMQDFYEYRRKVKRGKYPKPFDAAKKPLRSVLKHTNPSPINPFFKRAYNINYWTPEVTTTQLIEQLDPTETDL